MPASPRFAHEYSLIESTTVEFPVHEIPEVAGHPDATELRCQVYPGREISNKIQMIQKRRPSGVCRPAQPRAPVAATCAKWSPVSSWLKRVCAFCDRRFVYALLVVAACNVAATREVSAAIVERIVAVVGERAILMSDLRERARPLLVRIHQELPAGAQRSAAISQLYKSVVERLVDEELISRVARKSKIVITEKEVDTALTTLARQNNITIERLLLEAHAQGQTDAKYREEIRRQLLEYRVMNVRLQGRVQVRDEDVRRSYRDIMLQERKNLSFSAAWILVRPQAQGPAAVEVANSIVRALREGRSFAALARQYSSDKKTASRGGELGHYAPGKLPTPIDRALMNLEPGEYTMPIHIGDSYVVAQLLSRDASQLPTLEEAKAELVERVYSDKMGQARRRWLDGLRKQMHVEIRL